jgi:MFS family permease
MDSYAFSAVVHDDNLRPAPGLALECSGSLLSDLGAPMSIVQIKTDSLRKTKPHEYASRFIFGGISTVIAGIAAHFFGPVVGGLFLAFPVIFPASASLIESHQKQEKRQIGLDGTNRGRVAASTDAAGASAATIGLAAFGFVCWRGLLSTHNSTWILLAAFLVWLVVSLMSWLFRKSRRFPLRRRQFSSPFQP